MSNSIQQVPLEYVNQLWPSVEGYIAAAMEHAAGDYTVEDARVMVTQGSWTLIVAMDDARTLQGAAIVFYFNRPSERVGFIVAMGGKLITNKSAMAQLEGILRSNGATFIEAAGRESMVRLCSRYGMKPKYTIIGRNL
tara:strand:+ start:1138 stop:1551 length:414 start_codon:yes stop_codon:yes gene_type:complete